MKPGKTYTRPAAVAGFLAGCLVMHFILPGKIALEKTPAPNPPAAAKPPRAQNKNAPPSPKAGAQTPTTALSRGATRRFLAGIKRDKVASVDVRFFEENEFGATDGKLSRQFTDFFELTPDESSELSGLLQTTKAEMWNAAKAHAQTSQTETGGIVIKIPPVSAGPDIYDKVMNGFRALLGDDRYNDVMLYNKTSGRSGGQLENLFNQFGAMTRTVTMEKTANGRYEINEHTVGELGTISSGYSYTGTVDEINKRTPELVEFLPAPEQHR